MTPSALDLSSLHELLEVEPGTVLVSVDTELVFAEGHLPDSIRNGVYEMGFVDRMREQIPALDRPIVLYASEERSHGPAFAAEKLQRAGYTRVHEFDGGVETWRAAGLKLVGSGEAPELVAAFSGRLELDPSTSRLRWVGRNLANLHEGLVGLASGWVELTEGVLCAGELVLDLTRLECSDIADPKINQVLLRHLRDHDFFDVERHPQARVRLDEVRRMRKAPAGRPNYTGTATLGLRGVERPLAFTLTGGPSGAERFSLQGPVTFDRTEWGAIYGSAKFFTRLGMHLVNDLVDLDLRLNFGTAG